MSIWVKFRFAKGFGCMDEVAMGDGERTANVSILANNSSNTEAIEIRIIIFIRLLLLYKF